jgi:hypothetical protein
MDYKFTFEDGSEALLHYGVKGMKWGRWNAETQARYNGLGKSMVSAGQMQGAGGLSEEAEEKLADDYAKRHGLDEDFYSLDRDTKVDLVKRSATQSINSKIKMLLASPGTLEQRKEDAGVAPGTSHDRPGYGAQNSYIEEDNHGIPHAKPGTTQGDWNSYHKVKKKAGR